MQYEEKEYILLGDEYYPLRWMPLDKLRSYVERKIMEEYKKPFVIHHVSNIHPYKLGLIFYYSIQQ